MPDRQLEPEVMDSDAEAVDYNAIDHREVNRRFVNDLLESWKPTGTALDLGTGTALIPIELCQAAATARVVGVDMSEAMLALGRKNIEAAGLSHAIRLELADAKRLPFDDATFDAVISNSIVHHIPEPYAVLSEAVRVLAPGGVMFIRDLMRPADEAELHRLVEVHASSDSPAQRQMFADSLRAALTLAEMRELVERLGFSADDVSLTSDRHWTWRLRCGRDD